MRERLRRYAARIDALSLRERVLVFAASATLALTFLYTLLLEPQMAAQRRAAAGMAQKRAEAKSLEAELTKLATSRAADPDRPLRERLAALRARLGEVERRIGAEERKFTAPDQMKAVIEEMLARNRAVQLVALKTLPTTTIVEARAAAAKAEGAPVPKPGPAAPAERLVYRHGVEVTVSGAYLDLLAYAAELEKLPTQLYWSSLELDASRYPRHAMKIVVYTLSLDPSWLNV